MQDSGMNCIQAKSGMVVTMACVLGMCVGVYGHVWQREVEGGGVVKSVSFKSISPWFKPTWFKAHCDHF